MLTNHERAEFGRRAMEVGAPDFAENDLATNAIDTIANVLHAASALHEADEIVRMAVRHFEAEYIEETP